MRMSNSAIQVEGLYKKYIVGPAQEKHDTFYELLTSVIKSPLRKLLGPASGATATEEFWALNEINFKVEPGEVVGVIGRNGAGKSTLLKILSRITAPTKGRIEVRGRLASLLEVGTGFHPELSGRENIFLNGAILGMTRREIAHKFDEIVAFAEIEKFIDTPVKRYSSGMYVRLAFAVAAHLDADVLLVDEVLAVGDAAFQRRCLGKMQDVASSGRTILFVSHNMVAIQSLCTRGIYLSNGTVAYAGSVDQAISEHLRDMDATSSQPLHERSDRTGDGRLRFVNFWIENVQGERIAAAMLGQTNVFCLEYKAIEDLDQVYVAFDIRERAGEAVTNCNTADVNSNFRSLKSGEGVFRCVVPRFPIRAGRYVGNVYCSTHNTVNDFIQSAIIIDVEDGNYYGTGSLRNICRVQVEHQWSVSDKAFCRWEQQL